MCIRDRQQAVWHAVRELSPKLREVAILRYYGGLQYGEIGEVLDICLLYTSDAADERSSVDLGGRRIIKKKKKILNRGVTSTT